MVERFYEGDISRYYFSNGRHVHFTVTQLPGLGSVSLGRQQNEFSWFQCEL